MYRIALALALMATSSAVESAAVSADNGRLAGIFKEDQQARQLQPIDWRVLAPRDRAHRAEVLRLLEGGKVVTAKDYFHAAMVFQHGDAVDDYRTAFALAHIAATLDPSLKQARWKMPQWYATQYHQPAPGGPMALYKVDESAVADEERVRMNVPTLQVAKDQLLQINKK